MYQNPERIPSQLNKYAQVTDISENEQRAFY